MRSAERGSTRIADRVIAKIASQAAREALPDAREVRGPGGRPPSAAVAVRDRPGRDGLRGEARVRVAVELGYPCDIGARCGAVRRQVSGRVRALAGMDVREVAVTVERLRTSRREDAGWGRVR
ncbi:Asp23/Gls24 family envelope stress response protein [Streptomyces sp. NPDC057702]|uniref:Asp23/Gls24 family envelope stress response protein n=1 Tax=unclassified Streptomyces TaxID=2593676 RepID=UPI0036B5779D